jgi:Cft2 family RNA processing exonuclease
MRVTMTQQPVGQGGLFEGNIKTGNSRVRWVYDCGSNQTGPLHRQIVCLANAGPVDLLFLSHLDSDHISGVEELLKRTQVSETVLPYLKDTDLALTICRDSKDDRLTPSFALRN